MELSPQAKKGLALVGEGGKLSDKSVAALLDGAVAAITGAQTQQDVLSLFPSPTGHAAGQRAN